ncbi:Diacylglycerol kinase family enzyme [Pricia antarctica]|uniref:Diacylglycerol kinase family enzyme n=1 Tax=Pricia antarctica TaxID=641691 RepID=A0A1G7I6D4_9FLAO|nr:diacylglycerol kinase family protein [Pricia antarctica]SDF08004.1 Diacylglycerol kinase family enzyme [Pricia antarctica]
MNAKLNKVLLVINPVSGDTDKTPIIDMITDSLGKETEYSMYTTTGKEDIDKLRKKVKAFRPDRILVVGGDGTIKLAAQVCHDQNVTIGIIPAGSANGLATDLELPQNHEKALTVAMGDQIKSIDALRIRESIGLHICDMGINAELIKNYSDSAVRGHFGYLVNSIPTLWKTESPYRFSIAANGVKREVDAVMVAFANSKKFGTGALVNPNGKIDDGKFEVLIFKELNFFEVLKTLNGNIDMTSDFVEVIQSTEVRVTTEKPVSFQIDGEFYDDIEEITVTILPDYVAIAT